MTRQTLTLLDFENGTRTRTTYTDIADKLRDGLIKRLIEREGWKEADAIAYAYGRITTWPIELTTTGKL